MNLTLNEKQGLGQWTLPTEVVAAATTEDASAGWLAAAGGPIALAVTGAVTGLKLWWNKSKLAGERRITATKIVNRVEPVMQQNLAEYLATPDRTTSLQAEAVNNFDLLWQMVKEACGVSELGQAGRRCISDRERGGQFDWFARYRDPIANDTDVREPTAIEEALPQVLQQAIAGVPWSLILGIGLIGGALLLGRK